MNDCIEATQKETKREIIIFRNFYFTNKVNCSCIILYILQHFKRTVEPQERFGDFERTTDIILLARVGGIDE